MKTIVILIIHAKNTVHKLINKSNTATNIHQQTQLLIKIKFGEIGFNQFIWKYYLIVKTGLPEKTTTSAIALLKY